MPRQRRRRRLGSAEENELWRLSILKSYVAQKGWSRLYYTTRAAPGVPLGKWVTQWRARHRRGRLLPWLRDALEEIPGWSWDPRWDRLLGELAEVRAWAKRHGWDALLAGRRGRCSRVPERVRRRVHQWRHRGREGTLNQRLRELLEGFPRWSWGTPRPRLDGWERLHQLHAMMAAEGWARVPGRFPRRTRAMRDLSEWLHVVRQQYGQGRLAPELVAALEAVPGWGWDGREAGHVERLDQVRRLLQLRDRDGAPLTVAEVEWLGRWIRQRRVQHQRGRSSPALDRRLAAIPGWAWRMSDDTRRGRH